MYIIYRSKDYDGELVYNINTVIGIFDNYIDAKTELIKQLTKLKYNYDITDDNPELGYMFIKCFDKNGKKFMTSGLPCFEIMNRKVVMNTIKFK